MDRFICSHQGEYDKDTLKALCDALRLYPLSARALMRLGLSAPETAGRFLSAETSPLLDPFLLPDMDRACTRIREAVSRGEKICVYGDYDADGVCAASILLDCLKDMHADAFAYIPHRLNEGYGMHAEAVQRIQIAGTSLIVTVDNGISARDEIALAASLGMDVIVTDHHSISGALPDCTAVVSALREGARYENRALCGAGLAMQLSRALAGDAALSRWLPLAALASVADVVALTGENRVIVARGLPLAEENLGLRSLLRAAGNGGTAIDETTLAFQLAPRLNASGRLGDAMRAVHLLSTDDPAEAEALSEELDAENTRRRSVEAEILADAERMLAETEAAPRRAILLRGKGWNAGVIGIVASRLCEAMYRPAILFSEDENGILTGSGRSIDGVDLHAALCACKARFIRFGGHAGAAGITMEAAEYDAFCTEFCDILERDYPPEAFLPHSRYDETVRLDELTLATVGELKRLAPFGEGNGEPVYRINCALLGDVRRIGRDGKHLSLRVSTGKTLLRAVGFNMGDREEAFSTPGCEWSLLVRANVHTFRDRQSVELQILDAQTQEKVFNAFFEDILYNGICVEDFEFVRGLYGEGAFFDDAFMRRAFVLLREGLGEGGASVSALERAYSRKLLCALLVFCELSFFTLDLEKGTLQKAACAPQRSLSESTLYRIWSLND